MTPQPPARRASPAPAAPGSPTAPDAPAGPHTDAELTAALRRPLRLIDLVLAVPERVAANVAEQHALPRLALCFALTGALFAIPYGLVHGLDSWWILVPLYLGSTLICLPSLHVFSTYLGFRVDWGQTLVLALSLPAAAALFTFGFAPILGFLRATMDAGATEISWRAISRVLLAVALLAGIGQLWRCALQARRRDGTAFLVLVGVWHAVLLYVIVRMADLLGLFA